MHDLQATIIAEMGVKPSIDPAEEVARRVQFLVDYARAAHARGFVLGISGGVDSTLAGRLAQLAVEEMGDDADFVGVRLPYGKQVDEEDAEAAMRFVGARTEVSMNILGSVDALEASYEAGMGRTLSDFNKGNVKARVRMIAQYAIAGDHGLLVVGTDHGAESVTGFFTKYGDGGADVLPLYGLNKRQNRALLNHLGAPAFLYEKVPTADLLDDAPLQSDEAELGITYDEIDDYLEGRTVSEAAAARIEAAWRKSRHKRHTPASPLDDWWRN